MLSGIGTLESMKTSFKSSEDILFAERLLERLSAGHNSAALKLFGPHSYPELDSVMDHHSEPITELKRLSKIAELEITHRV